MGHKIWLIEWTQPPRVCQTTENWLIKQGWIQGWDQGALASAEMMGPRSELNLVNQERLDSRFNNVYLTSGHSNVNVLVFGPYIKSWYFMVSSTFYLNDCGSEARELHPSVVPSLWSLAHDPTTGSCSWVRFRQLPSKSSSCLQSTWPTALKLKGMDEPSPFAVLSRPPAKKATLHLKSHNLMIGFPWNLLSVFSSPEAEGSLRFGVCVMDDQLPHLCIVTITFLKDSMW